MYFVKDHAKVFIAVAVVLLVGGAAALWFLVFNGEAAQEAREKERLAEPIELTVKSSANGWDENTSTPLIIHIEGTDQSGKSVSLYHALPAYGETSLQLESGEYKMGFISPVNADGATYALPNTVEINKQTAEIVNLELTLREPEAISKDEAETLVKKIGEAVAFGDETISGTRGKNILNKAKANIRNAPNVGTLASDVDTAANTTTTTTPSSAQAASAAAAAASSNSSASANSGQGQTAASTPTTSNNNSNTANSASNNQQSQSSSQSSAASATKNWKDTTYKENSGKIMKWIERDDGTGYFEEVEEGSERVIDVAGHWE